MHSIKIRSPMQKAQCEILNVKIRYIGQRGRVFEGFELTHPTSHVDPTYNDMTPITVVFLI